MKSAVGAIGLADIPRFVVKLSLTIWLSAAAMGAGAADRLHQVKPGETLSGVARKHGVSVAALAERNGMKSNAPLLAGARLAIPSSRSRSTPSRETIPAAVQTAITNVRVDAGRWQHIVIHHSGTAEGSAKGMNEYHLRVRHMENGLAYHFVIGNGRGMGDGEIYVGDRWKKQLNGGHLASEEQNQSSLGICLVGNFDAKPPTSRQLTALTALVEALQARCRLEDNAVVTHQQINVIHTRCPGTRFPMKTILALLAR